MQKAIFKSRRLYKSAKRNKLLVFFFTCVFFFFSKIFFPNFISNDTKDGGPVYQINFFYVYITCFGIQVEKCSRKVVEKCLYSQYEQETRIKGRGREHLLWDFEAE